MRHGFAWKPWNTPRASSSQRGRWDSRNGSPPKPSKDSKHCAPKCSGRRMAKGPSKSAAVIQRLLEERRQYEAWLARITATVDSAPEHVRTRVKADYEARLKAVTEELRAHADAARQLIAQRKENLLELQKKEKAAAERLAETELRHEVGEYDEGQWAQVHKDALADLGAVRDEMMDIERDITRLEELDSLVKAKPATAAARAGAPPRPPEKPPERRKTPIDELAFLKSVTEDDRTPS